MTPDIPVWTIEPDWSDGVVERLAWLSDVLASDTGAEQRRGLRLSPRRDLEFTATVAQGARSYLDLVTHRLGSEEWLLPLWHDQAELGYTIQDDARFLPIDNRLREFAVGGLALIYEDTFTWEAVEIESMTATGLRTASPIERGWLEGTRVFPLRRAQLDEQGRNEWLTGRVGRSSLRFTTNDTNDYPAAFDAPIYAGLPVMTIEPDRKQAISYAQTRLQEECDNDTGLRYRRDSAGRAFAVQAHSWVVEGREAHAQLRSMLYALAGRQRAVWLPTFQADAILTCSLIVIHEVGLQHMCSS